MGTGGPSTSSTPTRFVWGLPHTIYIITQFTLRWLLHILFLRRLVTRAGIEPALPAWEAGVLTAWPTSQIFPLPCNLHSAAPRVTQSVPQGACFMLFLVHHQGLEPGTPWLRVRCSTNWANGAYLWVYISAPSKLDKGKRWRESVDQRDHKRSSPRPISTAKLNASRHLHTQPINLVVYKGSY